MYSLCLALLQFYLNQPVKQVKLKPQNQQIEHQINTTNTTYQQQFYPNQQVKQVQSKSQNQQIEHQINTTNTTYPTQQQQFYLN
ncbi:1278_t:CDS:2 [Dentiscutata erythropus]|uniref:1278_t:CDS:1 n=1 Tax=Dentiscutata erythropus TaxID=1348616 RepID=A0A9N9EV78_9GLOM|nr:1278_t:CDS:2 [Dentiscutata erythropus]